MNSHRTRFTKAVSIIVLLVFAQILTPPLARAADDDTTSEHKAHAVTDKDDRKASLQDLKQMAAGVTVHDVEDKKRVERPLVETPVFRYSDPRRFMRDAALWRFGKSGRPTALVKTELYNAGHGVYCLASLSDDLIEVDWKDDRPPFQTKQPGVAMKPIPDGPRPHAKSNGRLLQMKRLTRRFAATIQNADEVFDEMRILPTPVCRYSDDAAGLIDGAVFGLTMGTNPDALLLVELHKAGENDHEWRYGLARMTSGGLAVRLDDVEVWTVPYSKKVAGRPDEYDRWMWRRFTPER